MCSVPPLIALYVYTRQRLDPTPFMRDLQKTPIHDKLIPAQKQQKLLKFEAVENKKAKKNKQAVR